MKIIGTKSSILTVISILWWAMGFAGEEDFGTLGGHFLRIGVGSRAVALGETFTGLADDATALYWNPGGLAQLTKNELSLTHISFFQGISYENLIYTASIYDWGTMGVGFFYLHMGSIEGRDIYGNPTQDFTASDLALVLSYGRRAGGDLFFGVSLKYIQENIEYEVAKSFAIDIGGLARLKNLGIGVSVLNMGRPLRFIEKSYDLPLSVVMGTSYKRLIFRRD